MTLVDIQIEERIFYDYTVSLGVGGMFLETSQPLNIGDTLQLRFVLPKSDHIFEAAAKVVWKNDTSREDIEGSLLSYQGVGLALENISDEDGEKIKTYVSSLIESKAT